MAENEAPQGADETPEAPEAPESQEVDWKAEARKHERRAKENLAAAKANEDAAKRLAEIEEAQKTEAQKAQDALSKAQQELAAERTARVRAEVAAAKGVPASLLTGSTQEELEASAADLIEFKGVPAEPSPFPKADPSQGARGSVIGGTNADRFESFLGEKLK